MAKSRNPATTRAEAHRRRARRQGSRLMLTCLLFGVALLAAMPTMLVLAVGLVPSLVAFITDLTPGRYAFRCVFALNISGVAPSIFRLWQGSNDMEAGIGIISDVFAWLSFYGAAGLGWLLFFGLPGVVAAFVSFNASRKVGTLKERQAELIAEWGPAIHPANSAEANNAADDAPKIDDDDEAREAA